MGAEQAFRVNVPGQHAHALVQPWTGTSHPVWFKDDPRVANCKALGGVFAREVMEGFVATQKMFEEQIKPLPPISSKPSSPTSRLPFKPGCRRAKIRASIFRSTRSTARARWRACIA